MRGLQEISQDSVESVKKYFHFLIINIILLTSSAKKEKETAKEQKRKTRNEKPKQCQLEIRTTKVVN